MLAPGAGWLLLFFLVPLATIVYTSLQSGGLLLGGFRFTWEFSNYAEALSQNGEFFARSLQYSAIVTVIAIFVSYPMTYWIAFHGGRWKTPLLSLCSANEGGASC